MKRMDYLLFEVSVKVLKSAITVKLYYDSPLKRFYVDFNSYVGPKHRSFAFWFPPPPKKTETTPPRRRFIVCHTYERGKRFAVDSGWDPQECVFLNTNHNVTCLRGLRIDPLDLYFDSGWTMGKYSHEFEYEMKYAIKR